MKMFCITLEDNHYQKIKNFGYLPVGLGTKIKNDNFLRDNTGNNISKKPLLWRIFVSFLVVEE